MDLFAFLVLIAVVLAVFALVFARRRAPQLNDGLTRQDAAKAEVRSGSTWKAGTAAGHDRSASEFPFADRTPRWTRPPQARTSTGSRGSRWLDERTSIRREDRRDGVRSAPRPA